MTESPLEKVLRLTGGITRSYVRAGPRGPVRVGQYANHRHVAWGSLKPGEKVLLNNVPYQVVAVNVPLSKAETAWQKAGKAAAAAKLKAQGPSAGQKAALQKASAASAAARKAKASGAAVPGAKAAPVKVKIEHIELRNLVTKRIVVVSNPASMMVMAFG